MKLKDILNTLFQISKEQKTSEVYLCGGIPRDKYIKNSKSKYDDLDFTTGDSSVQFLAEEFYNTLSKHFSVKRSVAEDGHNSIYFNNIKLDFSSNFKVPNIDFLLRERGITKPTELQKEMFSRDFTCNALLLTLDLKTILDPTKQGFTDIKNKILKTCLDPDNTFRYNLTRIPRVFYIATKLGFEVAPEIIEWIKNNKDLLKEVDPRYISKKLSKSAEYDLPKLIDLLNKTNVWDQIPIIEELQPYYQKYLNSQVILKTKELEKQSQFFRNFDYTDNPTGPGTGLYSNLDKYKSVDEFRKKKKKLLKKLRKKIIDTRPK